MLEIITDRGALTFAEVRDRLEFSPSVSFFVRNGHHRGAHSTTVYTELNCTWRIIVSLSIFYHFWRNPSQQKPDSDISDIPPLCLLYFISFHVSILISSSIWIDSRKSLRGARPLSDDDARRPGFVRASTTRS